MDLLQMAEQLRKALQMYAQTLTDEQALEIASVYPSWEPKHTYKIGDYVTYGTNATGDPQLYKVVQDHTSQDIYPPGEGTESLYDALGLDESGYPIWTRPSGAHDAYMIGDIVNYNGQLYRSLIDGNTYTPEEYPAGWELYTE